MANDDLRYDHPQQYHCRLVYFTELGARIIGTDDRCTCTVHSLCPLRREGKSPRCTVAELQTLDQQAIVRRAWQSGGE